MSFQKTVLTVAIVLFVILMALIAVMMTSAKQTEVYPPQTGSCPDFWQLTQQGKCLNSQNLGKNCTSPMDFSKMNNKQKCNFAKDCKVPWDGITNAVKDNGQQKYC